MEYCVKTPFKDLVPGQMFSCDPADDPSRILTDDGNILLIGSGTLFDRCVANPHYYTKRQTVEFRTLSRGDRFTTTFGVRGTVVTILGPGHNTNAYILDGDPLVIKTPMPSWKVYPGEF